MFDEFHLKNEDGFTRTFLGGNLPLPNTKVGKFLSFCLFFIFLVFVGFFSITDDAKNLFDVI